MFQKIEAVNCSKIENNQENIEKDVTNKQLVELRKSTTNESDYEGEMMLRDDISETVTKFE